MKIDASKVMAEHDKVLVENVSFHVVMNINYVNYIKATTIIIKTWNFCWKCVDLKKSGV